MRMAENKLIARFVFRCVIADIAFIIMLSLMEVPKIYKNIEDCSLPAVITVTVTRPGTPVFSRTAEQAIKTNIPASPAKPPPVKLRPIVNSNKQVIIQPKENPELIPLLKNIQTTSARTHAEITAQGQKVAEVSNRLTNVEDHLKVLQHAGIGGEIVKPDLIPFKTWDEIIKYDERSEDDAAQMKRWLLFHNDCKSIDSTIRHILQHNYLLTEQMLTQITWSGSKGTKTKKKPIFRRRIFHEFRQIMVQMYPTMTNYHFKTAVQNALKAANFRVKDRIKRSNHVNRVVRRNSLDEYFDQDWTLEVNEEENGADDQGNDEQANGDGEHADGDGENADGDPPGENDNAQE
ncbi:hypothetical protein KQX54_014973 [Cotesia glomerata]|uniref:DUF4806 domain-containing protein n=1 Tax=Cotesia glomerata TaxID=32391 RepID=A0AAV7IWZ9_COTGL|nr:hypothetical protein KQX54_014973 [Cotesia glomerata]